jgi:hypothetical protein
MKIFPAKTQRRRDVLGFFFAPLRLCEGKTFVAILIALSFLTTLVPIAGASADEASTMPCCVGKTAGHCESGVAAKKPPQPKEPMCGLHNDSEEDDDITIVAEPTHTESHKASTSPSSQPAAESASLSEPCRMDCGACLSSSTRQQKRERGIVQAATSQTPLPSTFSAFKNSSVLFSSNEDWEQTSPRGPPSDLL